MLLTEEEAKTKTCPFTFTVPELHTSSGHSIRQVGPLNCVGADCMLWRWSGYSGLETKIYHGTARHTACTSARFPPGHGKSRAFEFEGHRWSYRVTSFDDDGEFDLLWRPDGDTRAGYCGMASRPE